MTKPMMDLPMNTRSESCGCGGPPEYVETPCPKCGEKGARVKAGTVRFHLRDEFRGDVVDKIYGLCLSPDCDVSWYAQDGSHAFSTEQTDTQIWTKKDADPQMACYCNGITREMVAFGVSRKGLRTMEEIILLHRDKMERACAAKNPSGRCCQEHFEKMIAEELLESMRCKCG